MSILSFFSSMLSKRSAPATAEAILNASAARTSRPAASADRRQAPSPRRHAAPAPHPPPPPAPAAVREAEPHPAVPAVGARGETDLEPSRARVDFDSVSFPSVQGSADDVDRAAIRELFSDIAAGQAGPVKTFIGDLRAGNATGEWLQVCRPLMAVLVESATSLGLDDAVPPMSEFVSALDLAAEAQEGDEGAINGAARDVLLEAYDALAKQFPSVFALGGAVSRRDTMLLHALLKQVPGVGVVTFDALYGAGLTSVETLKSAKGADIAAVSGLAAPLCEAICAALREHQDELDRTANLPADRRYSGHLGELLRAMAREHESLVRMSEAAGVDDARAENKRIARRNRNLYALKIEATLIEMGEVDRADALRVLSFDRRIETMETFLGVRVAKRAAEQR